MQRFVAILAAYCLGGLPLASTGLTWAAGESGLRIATFQVDATPPLGTPLCGGAVPPAREIVDPLSARGIVLLTENKPIVLCAVDWVGISNGGHDAWRDALAKAAGTTRDRVTVHTVHQHDAPCCDFLAAQLLAGTGLDRAMFDVAFAREVIARAAAAVEKSLTEAQAVTHLGVGAAIVEKVASNRRILGPDSKVEHMRYSSCRVPQAIAAPEGTIDPKLRMISFWNQDRPLAVVTHYATHPQSYYGQGGVSSDFVGIAREMREAALPGVAHIHFNGAGGNIAAGKYNNGEPAVRPVLARRLAGAMQQAWEQTQTSPISAGDVGWQTVPIVLPPRVTLDEQLLVARIANPDLNERERIRAATDLAFLRRVNGQVPIDVACLSLGEARVVYMPGELFVEYQLAAQQLCPHRFVAMAAYSDCGPGYIGTEIAYSQGGYETGIVSRTAPRVEGVLDDALHRLLAPASDR